MRFRCLLYVSIALSLGGCEDPPPTIDGRSNMAFQASIDNISASLDASTREEFFVALGTIAASLVDRTDTAVLETAGPMEMTQITTQKLRKKVDGYTAADVIYTAREIREQRE